ANQSGDHRRARNLADEALQAFRALGDRQGIATAGVALANAERGLGHLARAEGLYRESLELFRDLDHKHGAAIGLNHPGSFALDAGDVSQALPPLTESLRLLQATDNPPALIGSLSVASRAAGATGQWELAARLTGALETLRTTLGLSSSPTEEVSRQQVI